MLGKTVHICVWVLLFNWIVSIVTHTQTTHTDRQTHIYGRACVYVVSQMHRIHCYRHTQTYTHRHTRTYVCVTISWIDSTVTHTEIYTHRYTHIYMWVCVSQIHRFHCYTHTNIYVCCVCVCVSVTRETMYMTDKNIYW